MAHVCRHAAKAVAITRALRAPAARTLAPSLSSRAFSYDAGSRGGAPWSGYSGGNDTTSTYAGFPRRQVERRAGDWDCPECGNHVFASRVECPQCQQLKPVTMGGATDFGGAAGGYDGMKRRQREPVWRDGDWECPSCHFHNFASRRQCHRCELTKPVDLKVDQEHDR